MGLNRDTINDLKREAETLGAKLARLNEDLASLNTERNQILSRLGAIQNIVGVQETLGFDEAPRSGNDLRTNMKGVPLAASGSSVTVIHNGFPSLPRGGSLQGMPFRDAVRTILRQADHPLRPMEVTELLKKAGIENPGSIDFNSRVSSELFKLRKMGEVVRRRGKYVVQRHGVVPV